MDGSVCLISSTAAGASGAAGVSEMKIFNPKDGQGLSLANTMGIQTVSLRGGAHLRLSFRLESDESRTIDSKVF
jgi:3-deoxy-D-manno-octulosonate 8-phosphate phosphatase (KDO 8-P phosphatase)